MAQQAIEFIALNDDPGNTDIDDIQDSMTTALVSDVFNLKRSFIAKMVVALRKSAMGG